MNLTTVLTEVEAAGSRLQANAAPDYKSEMVNNVYPLLGLMLKSVGELAQIIDERLETTEVAFAEVLTQGSSLVLPELADVVVEAMDAATAVASELMDALSLFPSKEEGERAARATAAVDAFFAKKETAMAALAEVTLDVEDDDEDSGEQAPNREQPQTEGVRTDA